MSTNEISLEGMTVTRAPVPEPVERRVPLTEAQIADNYRRVKASRANTLVTINADGTRSWKHDIVKHGDGIKDTLATDSGTGTRDSLKLLAAEGDVRVEGLLPREPLGSSRDASGRFTRAK